MAHRTTISACLIVKNEAANLPRCLASLRDAVDEIVVVDTGSTDATLSIIAQASEAAGGPPVRLGHFTWVDDFAAARNAALDLATSDWILTIDADEELVVKEASRWRKALAALSCAYTMRLVNVGPSGTVQSEMADALRLFPRRPEVRYQGRLHEDIERALQAAGIPVAGLGAAYLRHHGYQPAAMAGKAERNRRLAELAANETPTAPLPWLFTAQAAWLARDAVGTLAAVSRAREALAAGGLLADRQRIALALVEVWARLSRGETPAADAVLADALALAPGHPELRYERGRRRVEGGDLAGAAEDFQACLRAHADRERFGSIRTGVTGFLAQMELVGIAATQGDMAKAAKHAAAAATDSNCPPEEAARLRALEPQLRQLARKATGR